MPWNGNEKYPNESVYASLERTGVGHRRRGHIFPTPLPRQQSTAQCKNRTASYCPQTPFVITADQYSSLITPLTLTYFAQFAVLQYMFPMWFTFTGALDIVDIFNHSPRIPMRNTKFFLESSPMVRQVESQMNNIRVTFNFLINFLIMMRSHEWLVSHCLA